MIVIRLFWWGCGWQPWHFFALGLMWTSRWTLAWNKWRCCTRIPRPESDMWWYRARIIIMFGWWDCRWQFWEFIARWLAWVSSWTWTRDKWRILTRLLGWEISWHNNVCCEWTSTWDMWRDSARIIRRLHWWVYGWKVWGFVARSLTWISCWTCDCI